MGRWGCFILGALLLATGTMGNVRTAEAAVTCSATSNSLAFGSVTTSNNTAVSGTFSVGASCSGGTANEATQYCLMIVSTANGGAGANGPLFMTSGSNTLNFLLYTDFLHSAILPIGTWFQFPANLNSAGTGILTTIYGASIPAGQTGAAPGNYTSSLSVILKVGDAGALNSNCTGTAWLTSNLTIPVSATNVAQCTVVGGTLSFNSVGVLNSNVDASTTISPNCASGVPYTISLDGGQHGGTSATSRKMANGAGSIVYGLFSDTARTQGWYGASVSATGTGSAQSISVYGRVAPQTTPAPGTYTDTVVITVTY
jgi:spore coat protein U-like protein